ncbi:MAG: oligoendopeptidase F [Firmicutes bacterium]|nr:oligoendopeptidase F [Bacillota bacterium]
MSETKKIRQRSEIPARYQWAIEDLYPTDEAWEQELSAVSAEGTALKAYEGTLGNSGESLFRFLEQSEKLGVRTRRLGNYCMRKADEDTRVAKYQAMSGRFMTAMVAMNAATSFETPEIMAIDDGKLESFYREYPALERYRRLLTDMRRRKDHVLSPAEERLLAAAGEMAQAPDSIFGSFVDADMKFPDAVDGKGNAYPLTQETFVGYERSADRQLRKDAYEKLYTGYSSFKNTSAAILDAQGKQLKFFADARKYPSTLDAALDATNVPTSVYRNLIEAVHQNLDKLHRYVRLRKRILGVDSLHMYDVYTTLLPDADKVIPYEEAQQTVCKALRPLGEEYCRILKSGFDSRWVDVYQNEGKRSGAYSAGADVHPYVLMNYTDDLDSQFTLAHEMGHAMHSYLSNKHQNPVDANYKIFVAEVASTCNEALLMEHLLSRTTDKRERAYLINHFLEQFKGTLFRQTQLAEFELVMGRMIGQGKTLTAEALCAEYKRLNAEYFGPDMVTDDFIAVEWAKIPHFFYNYYMYQYATGYSAAIALSRRILREGEPAVKDYLNFLSGGCSRSPMELLRGAGVDMATPAPVNEALKLFGELLDEMEELVK